jgi:heterodisulfide reductase subunit B
MQYALFLGCTAPIRGKHYESTARKVCEMLGVDLIDVPDFACCGFPLANASAEAAFLMAARNLAAAEAAGADGLMTLCSSCAATMVHVNQEIRSDRAVMDRTNKALAELGRHYTGSLEVKHVARVLWEDVGVDAIRAKVKRDLSSLKIATHPGCHFVKPGEVHGCFDDVEDPKTLDELVAATGAQPVSYEDKKLCCGGAVLGFEESTALAMAKQKLDVVKASGADAMISICPFCSVMYEANQGKIEEAYNVEYNLPVLYYTQLLGLALGVPEKELWFKMNSVRPTEMLEKVATE